MSPDCESGACRLALLGGWWVCCQCGGRGNDLTWCRYLYLSQFQITSTRMMADAV